MPSNEERTAASHAAATRSAHHCLPGGSEIGPELAGILQPGRAVVLGEREFLGYVLHWAADKPEGDPVRPVEGHGFQRGGNEPAPMHRRVVFG